MKNIVAIVVLLAGSSCFADSLSLDWMQGHWMGYQGPMLHEKVLTSSSGDIVVGANKLFYPDGRFFGSNFLEIKRESATSNLATLTFFSGTSIEDVLTCVLSELAIVCRTKEGFENSMKLIKGANSPSDDVFSMSKTFPDGTKATLTLKRVPPTVSGCESNFR